MKSVRISILVVAALSLAACSRTVSQPNVYPDQVVSFQVFYTELAPYGRWIDYSPYGYVWLPDVPVGFSPYLTQGHWVYTRYGWTWYSYYAWGWAPFHYGRWHFDPLYGWMWLPDTIWGPAWVAWRRGGGYSGWAPLGFGVTVQVVVGGSHVIPHGHWVFVRDGDLPRRHVHRYRAAGERNNELIERAPIPPRLREERSRQYMPGPEREEIEQTARRRVTEVELTERDAPGTDRLRNDRLEMFKPEIRRERPGEAKPAPPRIYRPEEIEEPSERKTRTRELTRRPAAPPQDEGVRRQPDVSRQPEISRQPRNGRQQRPTRPTAPKKKPSDDEEQQRSDRNRRRDF